MGKPFNPDTSISDNQQRKNWKLLRRSIAVVTLLCALSTALVNYLLQQQFQLQRAQDLQADQLLLDTLHHQTEQKLEQLYDIITSYEGVQQAFSDEAEIPLQQAFDNHWSNMAYDWQLDLIQFYSPANIPLASWSSRPIKALLDSKISAWVNEVNQTLEPVNSVSCVQNCSQYLITPIHFEGLHQGVMVISISLLDGLNQFQLSTKKTVGIITPSLNREASTDLLTYKWGYELYSLTDAGQHEPVLQGFTHLQTPQKGREQIYAATINGRDYTLRLLPLTHSDDSFLIILEDLTAAHAAIINKSVLFALLSFFTFLALQLLLQFSLQRQASRQEHALQLARVERSRPKQATEEHDDDPTHPEITLTNLTDTPLDFDLTSEHVISISDRLDQLKKYNQDINLELAHQMVAVSHERDLVRRILDNTQAIIMTLQKDGSILSINRFGQMITGYSEADLKHKNFIDLYPDNEPFALNSLQNMSSIANGEQESYRHEARLSCKDGKERVILWLHSRLNDKDSNDAPLLSAGLDITEHKQLEKNLGWLADHDSLTSLYNRRRFEEELEDALNWANTHQASGTLLYIDLDNFKDINDSCGHQVGDIILRKVASTLLDITDEIDSSSHLITARLGGDEFAMILRNIDEEGISILCKRVLDSLYQIRHNEENFQFQLSCSIGVASFPGQESNANELLSNADFAMYQAKMFGRNQYYVFQDQDSHREQSHHRLIWREKIESALNEGRFILHYQPILNIKQRTISHYETLIRMKDENDELVSPSVFINIAERIGLIQDIDCFILQSAIQKQAELLRQGHDITLAINLSGKAFDDPKLSENIESAIHKYNAKAENLIFEITETAAVSDIVAAEKVMRKIQSLGCQFALDDFGVGFSSFYYLRELPVEYVKIDGSFVNDLPDNSDNQVLVRALSEVAIGFNKLTVAEFVDSLQTLHLLSESKVNFAQGYFIGKPSEQIPVNPPNFYQAAVNENTAII